MLPRALRCCRRLSPPHLLAAAAQPAPPLPLTSPRNRRNAPQYPANALVHRPLLLALITADKVRSNSQVEGAFAYLSAVGAEPADPGALEAAAGVGAEVSPAALAEAVAEVVAANSAKLAESRYHLNLNPLLGQVRAKLRWADAAAARAELDAQVAALLGPKTEADLAPPEKKKKAPKEKKTEAAAPAAAAAAGEDAAAAAAAADPYAFLPRPDQNNSVHTSITFSDGRATLHVANTAAQLVTHLAATGGRVVTRFPPEPNGYLHIGHAKAMFVDFGMAARHGGDCYLRFDDTNPEAEKQEYIDHILEIVAWLGWAPAKVTYSSDYFDRLHALAVELIEGGNAYVCHQTGDQIKA